MDGGARRRLKREVASRGATIRTFNQPNIDINLTGASPEMRAYSTEIVRGIIELAGDLEVPGIVIGPGKINPLMPIPMDRVVGYFKRAMDILVPLAESVGTRLLVENMPFSFIPEIERLMAVVEDYGDPRLGIVYDLANGYFMRERPLEAMRRAGARLDLVHISDTGLNVCMHDPIGRGTIDYAVVRADLDEAGWNDPIVMEIIALSDNPDRGMTESLAHLRALRWKTEKST